MHPRLSRMEARPSEIERNGPNSVPCGFDLGRGFKTPEKKPPNSGRMISVLQRVKEREAKERAEQQKRQERQPTTILINHTSVLSGADSGTLHRMLTTEGATVSANKEDGSTTSTDRSAPVEEAKRIR